jgi:uncharacterized protein with HEPN domain
MSTPRRDRDYLDDLHEALRRVVAYTADLSYEEFLHSTKTQDAVIRNLQVMGEAAKKLSPGLRRTHAHIPWRQMAGMRDRIVHEYFGINYDIVWTVAREEIPSLLPQLDAIRRAQSG